MDGWHNASLILLRFFALCMRLPSLRCTERQRPASADTALGNGILLVSKEVGPEMVAVASLLQRNRFAVRDTKEKTDVRLNVGFGDNDEPLRLDHWSEVTPPASKPILQRTRN
ncbi:hypothetical protein [Caballeronia fortuita]|uniref:hypothetical protein n=1 Tax=Caballeronia fortuita TaxID=1777138 RepID=UPI0012FD33CF|nr:hypothetical protein [Caballeronia fortuita]